MVSDFYDAILATPRQQCKPGPGTVAVWRGLKDVIPEWPRRGGTKRGPADRMLAASGEAEKVEIFFGVTKDEDFREEEEETT